MKWIGMAVILAGSMVGSAQTHVFEAGTVINAFPVATPEFHIAGAAGEFVLKATHLESGPIADATLSFTQAGSGRIDRLSDNEYALLKRLRKELEEAETTIALAHGVDFGAHCASPDPRATVVCDAVYRPSDRIEFRGQFLLINVPEIFGK
jgi:hypothetical protein